MPFEQIPNQPAKQESKPKVEPKIEIEPGFDDFVPEDFKQNPIKYFEEKGVNIKSGEIKRDETGRVREDPTAVKDLPVWKNKAGAELHTVGKRVNVAKGKAGEVGDPFYEYKVMEVIQELGLPCPRPIVKAERGGSHLIVMERVSGIRWSNRNALHLKDRGYSDEDIENLQQQAQIMMEGLQKKFEEAGIIRGWKLKDMVFDINIENKKVRAVVPTDWERTTIDEEKLTRARTLRHSANLSI